MADADKLRADVALVRRGLAPSRERAQALIEGGFVACNGRPVARSAQRVGDGDRLDVLGSDLPYVGRGGFKLARALEAFGVDPAGQVCLDVGASTGGFTDVLLQSGAALVYAVDVGSDQLAPRLRADPRVVSMERTNARELRPEMFARRPALGVMDVSFISIRLILPVAFGVLGPGGRMIALVKPQFEAGPNRLGKKGVISDPAVHAGVLREIAAFAPSLGWRVRALEPSPIPGGSGNLEFLADFVPDGSPLAAQADDARIREVVRAAHRLRRGDGSFRGDGPPR